MTKIYTRECLGCGVFYTGYGAKYCGNKCRLHNENPMKGRRFSDEHRKKLSESHKWQSGKNSPAWRGGKPQCSDCGVQIGYMSKWCKKCSPKHADRKPREYPKGENHPNWIKDRSKVKYSEKKHLCTKYREWMFSVKNRDGWECKIYNEDCSGRLEAHHILGWVDYPELRYEVNNGITLCQAHHPRKRAEEKRLVPYFKGLVTVSNE